MTRSVSELARNDVPGAVALIEELLDAGTYSSDDGQMVAMLQDDAEHLIAEYGAMMKRRRAAGQPVAIISSAAGGE